MVAYLHRASGGGFTLTLCARPCNGEKFATAEKVRVAGKREANAICKARGAKPFVFDTGREAAEVARKLTAERGEKVQPRPLADDGEWKRREALRFEDGTYQHVPFNDAPWFLGSEPWREHFLHVSTERPDMVAFTESPAKGAADRQTRLKVGVYLTRYFSEVLSPDEIRDIATAFTSEREENLLLFARTADEIERVYVKGPSSCMAYEADEFSSPFHPVRVYAAGDLAVAYIERDEAITGRVLVWPERKIYGRMYGDVTRLRKLLLAAGYQNDALDGARMLRVECGDGFVAPYVDGALRARDTGHFLIIDEDGDVTCDRTDGVTEPMGEPCERCEERHDPSEMRHVHFMNWRGHVSGGDWCESCRDERAFLCDATSEWWDYDNRVEMADGEEWSRSHFENHGFTCDATGENYPNSERVTMADGDEWCAEHFAANGFTCPDCGENFPNEEGEEIDGEVVCFDCHAKREGSKYVARPATERELRAAEEAGQVPLLIL
jgi:hypothetical protein